MRIVQELHVQRLGSTTGSYSARYLAYRAVTFLNPLVLLALAAVSIPLMLHLFNLRKPQRVDFSSLAFVQTIEKAAVQKIQVKRWLLLALRMLAIAFLVLAFARPYWGSGDGTLFGPDARSALGVVVDNSSSMQQDGPSGPYLDQAVQRAQGVLRTMDTGDQAGIWATVPAPDQTAGLVRTRNAAQADLDAVAPRGGTPPLAQRALDAAQRVSESGQPRKVVYVASDFQRTRLGDSLRTAWPDDVALALLPVDTQPRANTGITDVRVASPIVEAGQPVDVEAQIEHRGATAGEQAVSLYFEDERVAQATVSPADGETVTATFTATPASRGWVRARVELEGDAFAPDDARYLSFFVPETRRILLVRGPGQSTRFVELALSDAVTGSDLTFETRVINRNALAQADLSSYDAVLLVGPERVASGERARLQQYVEAGGGVLLFPHPTPDAESYSALFASWGGGTVRGISGAPGGDTSVATLEQAAFDHPLFTGMFDTSDPTRSPSLERPAIWAALDWTPRGGQGQTLIALSTGAPFLYEWPVGAGRALTAAVAPTLDWSELPTRGLFVPLLYRSIFYVTAGASVEGASATTGVPTSHTLRGLSPQAEVTLEGPGDQRTRLDVTPRPGGASVAIPGLSASGVYALRTEQEVLQHLAVNHDAALTDLRPASADEAVAHYESLGIANVQALSVDARPEAVAEALDQRQAGGALWNVFMVLALIFVIAETAVSRLWTPETASRTS